MKTLHPSFIVGIGGSTGSLNSYKAFFDALPLNTDMAFVVISHIYPTANSQLAEILSRHTKMTVEVVAKTIPLIANHVYVLPPNADLRTDGYSLYVSSPASRNKQIDIFLTSLAKAVKERAIAIILSGYDGDGTNGCEAIKAGGGTTFAEEDAEVASMPITATASGWIDFVLPVDKIPAALQRVKKDSIQSPRAEPAVWSRTLEVCPCTMHQRSADEFYAPQSLLLKLRLHPRAEHGVFCRTINNEV